MSRKVIFAGFFPLWLGAQTNAVTAEPPAKLTVKAGRSAVATLKFQLAPGYHTNSNTPSDEYLIPIRLTWEAAPLEVEAVEYPKGHLEKYGFSDKPLSVYSGVFEITTRLRAPVSAPRGPRTVPAKLRYQACTDTTCYAPKTLTLQVPVDIQ